MPQPDSPAPATRNPWAWIPTLYLAEGLPNAIVVSVSVVLYKELNISNTDIAFYTSLFYLPWVLKPLWSPMVDILRTRRIWIWQTQLLMGLALGGLMAALPSANFFWISLGLFWLLALTSATHDIAADGFYILGLSESQQAFFSGVRNTCFRVASLLMQGPLIYLVAILEARTNRIAAWMAGFGGLAVLFGSLGFYHSMFLPRPASDRPGHGVSLREFFREFLVTFGLFFRKQRLALLLLFLLFYRFAEAQLLPMVQPFLLDPRSQGGLGLTTEELSVVKGTVGVIALMAGGIIGGIVVSWRGLRACLWPMVLIMHLPDVVFVYLASAQPQNLQLIGGCIALEQFGYGFGFTAYMLYMIYIARGAHSTAHYAICTGFMALGLMIPGMWSGWLQHKLGYMHFFMWVMLATIPGFIVTALIPLERGFGKKT